MIAALAAAGGVASFAIAWYEAKQDENADLECQALKPRRGDHYSVVERDGGRICIWFGRQGRTVLETPVTG